VEDGKEKTKRVSTHDLLFAGAVDPATRRRKSLFSNTLVLPGFNLYEALKIDDPKKLAWKEHIFFADLQGASLDNAQLQGASLYGVQLQGGSLRWAELQGASLDGADLQGASHANAIYILRRLVRGPAVPNNGTARIDAEAPGLVDFIMSKDCPVSAALTDDDKAGLLRIKRSAEEQFPPPPTSKNVE
jgi:hypothetical protein